MKKRLNIETIANELEGASAFFTRRATVTGGPTETPPPSTPIPPRDVGLATPVHPASHPSLARPDAEPSQSVRPQREEQHEPPNVPINARTSEHSFQRKKIRHTFDIYQDQLLSLRELALKRERMSGERVLLGDLAQEALDTLIAKERSNE